MSRMFCIECGNDTEPLFDNLCASCFRNRVKLIVVPIVVDIIVCKHCGAKLKGKVWRKVGTMEDIIRAVIIDRSELDRRVTAKQFEFEFNYRDWHNVAVTLRATLNVGELTLKDTYYIDARIKTRSCTQCSRMAGDYYEAILQVRAEERKLNADELDTIRAMVYSKVTRETTTAFLSKEVILDKGIDFYISSSFVGRQLAKQIADKFYGKYVESAKLVGKRAGKNLYRISFCVRIPDYKVGDFVVINDMLLRINRLDATNIHVYNLSEYKPETIARAQLRTTKLKILGGSELIQKAQLISVRGNEVQVLDPDDYSTVELIKPDGLSIGEPTATINVIKYDGNLYIIP